MEKTNEITDINYSPVPATLKSVFDGLGLEFRAYVLNAPSVPHYPFVKKQSKPRQFDHFVLSQLLEGDGFIHDFKTNTVKTFEAGYGLLLPPNLEQNYGGYRKTWWEDSICFSGPLADSLMRNNLIRPNIIYFGKERRILPIIRAIRVGTLNSIMEAYGLLLKLLAELNEENMKTSGSDHRTNLHNVQQKVMESDHFWTVDEMADYMNMSPAYLRRVFEKEIGIAPKVFLEQIWLKRATVYVCETKLPFLSIAMKMGCSDLYYFFRKFRRLTGKTPTEYRKTYGRR